MCNHSLMNWARWVESCRTNLAIASDQRVVSDPEKRETAATRMCTMCSETSAHTWFEEYQKVLLRVAPSVSTHPIPFWSGPYQIRVKWSFF